MAWLVHCGWLGCPYSGATLSVLSLLRRSRTSAAIAVRSAEAPGSSGHRRTTTTLAGRSAEAPASECSGRGRLLRRRVFGKLRFLLCLCVSGLVFSPSRIRRPEKSGERASEPFLVRKIAFLTLLGSLRAHAGAPPQAAVHACTTRDHLRGFISLVLCPSMLAPLTCRAYVWCYSLGD